MNYFQNKTRTILLTALILYCIFFIAETSYAIGLHSSQQKKSKTNPKLAATLNNKGNSYFAKANEKKLIYLDSAIVCYKKAMENDPLDAGIKFNLGMAYLAKGKTKEADSYFQKGYIQCKSNQGIVYKLLRIDTKKVQKDKELGKLATYLEKSFSKEKDKDKKPTQPSGKPTKPAGPPSLNVMKNHLYIKLAGGK